jgi:opacity protein-like surface antigen
LRAARSFGAQPGTKGAAVRLLPLILVGMAVVSCEGVDAADKLPPAPVLPSENSDAEFSGWYLRGDLGVGANATAPELKISPDPVTFLSNAATESFADASLSPFGSIGFGAGYQLNDWFRMDGTFEYHGGAKLRLLDTGIDLASSPIGVPSLFGDSYRANLQSFVGLINGYVNAETWYGFSPFVGAGLGFASNRISGFSDQRFCYPSCPSAVPVGGAFSNGQKTNFAWALMAGVDFSLGPNLKLEFGYRYLNYGSIISGGANCPSANSGAGPAAAICSAGATRRLSTRNALASNDFRLGVIYTLGELPFPDAVK